MKSAGWGKGRGCELADAGWGGVQKLGLLRMVQRVNCLGDVGLAFVGWAGGDFLYLKLSLSGCPDWALHVGGGRGYEGT